MQSREGTFWDVTAIRCFACEARETTARRFHEDGSSAGLYYTTEQRNAFRYDD